MADPRGKLPNDFGNADWDSLLSDLEQKVDAFSGKPPSKDPPKSAVTSSSSSPLKPEPESAGAKSARSPVSQPFYKPPQPGSVSPASRAPEPPRPTPSFEHAPIEELDEERTMVGSISRELIEEAARGGVGLGQLFDRPSTKLAKAEPAFDITFEDDSHSRETPVPPSAEEFDGVMTSAPNLDLGRRRAADDFDTPSPAAVGAVSDLPDPFADGSERMSPPPLPTLPGSAATRTPLPLQIAAPAPLAFADPFSPPVADLVPSESSALDRRPSLTDALAAGPKLLEPEERQFNEDEPTRIGQMPSPEELRRLAREMLGEKAELPRDVVGETPTQAIEIVEEIESEAPVSVAPAASPRPVAKAPAPPRAAPKPPALRSSPNVTTPTPAPVSAASEPEAPVIEATKASVPPSIKTPAPASVKTPAPSVPTPSVSSSAPTKAADVSTSDVAASTPRDQDDSIAPVTPDGGWSDERDAVAHLADYSLIESWLARAEWLEAEARALDDRTERARMFVVVAELLAMAGEDERAQQLGEEARSLAPNLPLAHRQARAKFVREQQFESLTEALDAEVRVAATPGARVAALLLSSEIARLHAHDIDRSDKVLDQALRAAPLDPRAHVLKLARELASTSTAPTYRVSKDEGLAPIAAAIAELSAYRGSPDLKAAPLTPLDALTRVRASLSASDVPAALLSLGFLGRSAGVGRPALWLASAFASMTREGRAQAYPWLEQLAEGEQPELAARFRAARAFEQGDADTVRAVLATPNVFSAAEHALIEALLGGAVQSERLDALRADGSLSPLGYALSVGTDAPLAESGNDLSKVQVALGNALAKGAPLSSIAARLKAVLPDSALALSLAVEQNLASGEKLPVAQRLSAWPRSDAAGPEFDRDRALAASLVFALAGDTEQALAEAESAKEADSLSEAAVRVVASLAAGRAASEIDTLAAEIEDPTRRALLLLEAAARLGPSSSAQPALLRLAHETAPELPFASTLGAAAARASGDDESLLSWVRLGKDAADDATETALESVREALLLDEQRELAVTLLEEASRAKPDDVALRALLERLLTEPAADGAQWRAARAERAAGASKAQLALTAALELERAGDLVAASRLAELAVAAGGGELAKLVRDRCDMYGSGAARLSEELMAAARVAETPEAEREIFERLAYLDETGSGDTASGLLWHRSILEKNPHALASLRKLENALVGEAREDELEPIFSEIAAATSAGEAQAHALVAARLRQRTVNWDATRELVEGAARRSPSSLWALRQLQSHALIARDDDGILRSTQSLAERTDRDAERATLLLRSAEATARKGELSAAADLFRQVITLLPDHHLARLALAEVLELAGEERSAAEAHEAAAGVSLVPAHQLEQWFDAAVLWLDKVQDRDRGIAALEQAAALDIRYRDGFERLRALYTEAGEREKLARLLERRLETEDDAEKRIELEVTLGRALAEVGDLTAAKRALAAALDSSPDNVDALKAFADLCAAEGDWTGAEQATIRLARLVTEPEKQAEIYMQLGGIYQEHLPNTERAELAYLEVLKRLPDSIAAREKLVALYASSGNKDKAIETQGQLLASSQQPADKRQRVIEMAALHEGVGGDVKKAEQTLDQLRKEMPHDTHVLRALAEFHTRHGHTSAVNVLLDRAAADARRALNTGRFELHFFANLATVFELRGNADGAIVAANTVRALEGNACELEGIGIKAAKREFDDYLAPEIFSPGLRELLRHAGEALDAATAVDIKTLRATPPPPPAAAIAQKAIELAEHFRLPGLQVYVSSAIGPVCMPISSNPPTILYGSALLSEQHEATRTFLTLRALKILQVGAVGFARTAPIDLWPMTAAFLQLFAPNWAPQGVDAGKLRDFKARIQKHLPQGGPDLSALALEITGAIGNRASTLQTAANAWGDRCALLATGDATGALDAIAFATGQASGTPTGADRLRWIGRNAEARDVMVWTVSDGYIEARKG